LFKKSKTPRFLELKQNACLLRPRPCLPQVADFKYRLDGRAGSALRWALPRFQHSGLTSRYCQFSLPPPGQLRKSDSLQWERFAQMLIHRAALLNLAGTRPRVPAGKLRAAHG
jgi:hypothetical protein